MLTMDDDEVELALMALWHLQSDANHQADGTRNFTQVTGAAWRCCKHVVRKCDALIARIGQYQKDAANAD